MTIVVIAACVAIIAVIGGAMAISSGGDVASPTPVATPAALTPPRAVAALPSAFKVVLTWAPSEGLPVSRYAVTRNGKPVASIASTQTTWVDDATTPETRYVYVVAAVGSDGAKASVRVATRTPTAPLSTARLDGTFNVHLHATSHFGFSNFQGENQTAGWRFAPTCPNAPCDTRLSDLHQKDFVLTLTRTGVTYHGTVSVSGMVTCSGADVTSSFTVTVHVTDAGPVRGSWVATKVRGEMSQDEAAQLGCVASGATYAVTGSVVR